jgi:ketosteroid isomerase-like protein
MNNLEIVQDAYAKFGNGDIAGLLALLSTDVHWQVPEIENSSFGGKCQGQEAVGNFFAALVADEDITLFEPREFIDGGDKIVVLGRSGSTVKATGKSYETDWVHIFAVKDGKITSFLEFFDNAAATRAFQKSATA